MEIVSLRFEKEFLHDVEKTMKEHRYATKTEFIREAIRDKIKDLEKEKALLRLQKAFGFSKKKTTDRQLKAAREKAFEEVASRFR